MHFTNGKSLFNIIKDIIKLSFILEALYHVLMSLQELCSGFTGEVDDCPVLEALL